MIRWPVIKGINRARRVHTKLSLEIPRRPGIFYLAIGYTPTPINDMLTRCVLAGTAHISVFGQKDAEHN